MAPRAQQAETTTTTTPSPTTTKKSSKLWKRLSGSGTKLQKKSNKKSYNKTNNASCSPTTVTATPMVAITVNGVTTCAVAADVGQEEDDNVVEQMRASNHGNDSHMVAATSKKYTMQDDVFSPTTTASSAGNTTSTTTNINNNNTASYFHSFISGHRLSFSEDDDDYYCEEEGNDVGFGLVIQEVIRPTANYEQKPSFEQQQREVSLLEGHGKVEEEEKQKWTPFGTNHEEDDHPNDDVVVEMVVERSAAEGNNEQPALSKTENVISEQQESQATTSKQQSQQPNIDDEDESLFKEVENIDTNNMNNQNIINANDDASPLEDPPNTQRKTLTPEFFLGSGSNNKNNTNLSKKKKERKRLDGATSTTFNASLTTHTTSRSINHHHHHYHMNTNQTNSPSIGMSKSTTSSSQEGHNMYAEIYIRTRPSRSNKKHHQPSYNNNNNPPPPPSGISRDRSTMSSNTNPSLAMTAISSLSGRSSMFGSTMMMHAATTTTTNHQQENNMPVTPEGHEMNYSSLEDSNGLHQLNNTAAVVENEYNYFDYDANVEAPLSPLGVSPKRQSKDVFGSNHHPPHHGWSSRSSNSRTSTTIPIHQWKSKVNNLWSSVSKHTCRCFGEPFSKFEESERDRVLRGDGSKTAATSTTAANTSAAAAAAAVARRMNQTPMFSTPLKEPGLFD